MVVHESHDIEARQLGGAHAKGRVLEDPGLSRERPQAPSGLDVNVGEFLVALAHLLRCHDVHEVAREAVRLERNAGLAQRRRCGDDHGDSGCRQLLEEVAGTRHDRNIRRVVMANDGADLLVKVVYGSIDAQLVVHDLATLPQGHAFDAVEKRLVNASAAMRAGKLDHHVTPHVHGVDERPVTVENCTPDSHRSSPLRRFGRDVASRFGVVPRREAHELAPTRLVG